MSSVSSSRGIDLEGQEGSMMSGVFRWKASHALRSLPPPSDNNKPADFTKGWMELFSSKCSNPAEVGRLVAYAQQDLCMIDCMSFPSSILNALFQSGVLSAPQKQETQAQTQAPGNTPELMHELHIVCIGCSTKAEERILRQTRCWHELGTALRHVTKHVHLHLVGPEMSGTQSNVPACARTEQREDEDKDERGAEWAALEASCLSAHIYKGTASGFFKDNKHLIPLPTAPTETKRETETAETETETGGCVGPRRSVNTIAVGLNCGFGNFENPGATKYDLLVSWYQDLCFLTALQCLPIVFTCANDYADLDGECRLHCDYFGSKFWCQPQRSAFNCASTFVAGEPGAAAAYSDYSCGNSYWYVVQGCEQSRRRKFANGSTRLPVNGSTPLQERYSFMHALLGGNAAKKGQVVPVWSLNEHCMISSAGRGSIPLWQYQQGKTEKNKEKGAGNETGEVAVTNGGSAVSTATELPPPPPSAVDEQIESEAPAPASEQEPAAPAAPAASLPAVSAAVPIVKQALNQYGDTLCVTCVFPVQEEDHGVVDLRSISALVGADGKTLLLEGGGIELPEPIALLRTIRPDTVTAKISSKHRRITVSARIAG